MMRKVLAAAVLAAVATPLAASAYDPIPPLPFSCSVHYTEVVPGVSVPSYTCYG